LECNSVVSLTCPDAVKDRTSKSEKTKNRYVTIRFKNPIIKPTGKIPIYFLMDVNEKTVPNIGNGFSV